MFCAGDALIGVTSFKHQTVLKGIGKDCSFGIMKTHPSALKERLYRWVNTISTTIALLCYRAFILPSPSSERPRFNPHQDRSSCPVHSISPYVRPPTPPKLIDLSWCLNYPPSRTSLSITYVLLFCQSFHHQLSGLRKKEIRSSFSKCFLGILETKQCKRKDVEFKETKHMQTVKFQEE